MTTIPPKKSYVCHHTVLIFLAGFIVVTSFTPATVKAVQSVAIAHNIDITGVGEDKDFLRKVVQVAENIKTDPVDLLTLMSFESAGTLDPAKQGPYVPGRGRAIGLIQFMPDTAPELATSSAELGGMSRVQQMDYVEKYLVKRGFKGGDLMKLYSTVFAGHPNASPSISDGYHTLAGAVERMKREHMPRAKKLLMQG